MDIKISGMDKPIVLSFRKDFVKTVLLENKYRGVDISSYVIETFIVKKLHKFCTVCVYVRQSVMYVRIWK